MAIRDLFVGPKLITQLCELRDELSCSVEVANGDEDVQNRFGTQAGDRRAADVVHIQNCRSQRRSELRCRFLEQAGPPWIVGYNHDLPTFQAEAARCVSKRA